MKVAKLLVVNTVFECIEILALVFCEFVHLQRIIFLSNRFESI